MPSPRASQSRSEAPSLIGYEFNAPEAGPTKPTKTPTGNHLPSQPNAHTEPPLRPNPENDIISNHGIWDI
jgi:hypothetical protein